MATLFLISLYLIFLCSGLFGAMFGSIWPVAQMDFMVGASYGAIVSICITGGAVIGSLSGAKVQRLLGVGKTALLGLVGIAVVCMGLSLTTNFYIFVCFAFLAGSMAGILDVTVNNYMANKYPPQNMSWLHGAWGVGSTLSTMIAAGAIAAGSWRWGYRWVAVIQVIICVLLFFLLPFWKASPAAKPVVEMVENAPESLFRLKGVVALLISMLAYGGIEGSINYWASSFLIHMHNFTESKSAQFVSFFFVGIMVSRLFAGIIAMKIGYQKILLLSQAVMLLGSGILLSLLPMPFIQLGLFLIGFGCGPVVPATVQLAAARFGVKNAQGVIGFQAAFLFLGNMLLPPLVGAMGSKTSMILLPIALLLASGVLFIFTVYLENITKCKIKSV